MQKIEKSKEEEIENLELKYADAGNWEELYELIKSVGTIETSAGKKDPQKIIDRIEGIKRVATKEMILNDTTLEIILRDVTRTDGLRDKVKELIRAEFKS
jgi:hypothetical protein